MRLGLGDDRTARWASDSRFQRRGLLERRWNRHEWKTFPTEEYRVTHIALKRSPATWHFILKIARNRLTPEILSM